MNARVDHLLQEALRLPAEDRSALLVALADSLEGDGADLQAVDAAWRAEILRRRDELRAGRSAALPWSEVRTRISAL